MNPASVGIVVVNHDRAALTLALLSSLADAVSCAAVTVRTCVVDNGSDASDRAQLAAGLEAFRGRGLDVSACWQHNAGYAGGVNRGLRELGIGPEGPDAFWVLNNDTRVDRDSLSALCRFLSAMDSPAIIGATLVYADGEKRLQAAGGARYFPLAGRSRHIGKGAPLARVPSLPDLPLDYIVGASMFFSREVVSLAGLLPEDYFLYFEELAWCRRAREAGVAMRWCRDAVVWHVEGASTGAGDRFRGLGDTAAHYFWRNAIHYSRVNHPHCVPGVWLVTLLDALRYVVRGDRGKFATWARAVRDARAGRRGMIRD